MTYQDSNLWDFVNKLRTPRLIYGLRNFYEYKFIAAMKYRARSKHPQLEILSHNKTLNSKVLIECKFNYKILNIFKKLKFLL